MTFSSNKDEIKLRHSFYGSGFAADQFDILPSPLTAKIINQYGLVLRKNKTGFVLYTEVDASSVGDAVEGINPTPQPRLKNELSGETLRFNFFLQAKNNYLFNITELSRYNPGRELFYFNNFRDDQELGLLYLGDSFTGQRVGEAIALVTAETITYVFKTDVNAATIVLDDSFRNTLHSYNFSNDDPTMTTSEYRVDLSNVNAMPAGRYSLTHVGSAEDPLVFYYEPELFELNPLAVIEIINSTVNLTADHSELVSSDYQFLLNDEIQSIDDYVLQLEARATTWRYNVIKKYDSNPYTLVNLDEISDFTKTIEGEQAIFIADSERVLSDQPSTIALNHSGTKLRNLPSPQLTTQLQQGASEDSYISDMYVYV